MKERILIVGSGASGVHFALSILKKGYEVVMLDVGRSAPVHSNPEGSLKELKEKLEDPVQYFLGSEFESVTYPGTQGEYYGFPPHKNYIFSMPESFEIQSRGFEPLLSFARGGLAEAWTGGVYPLNDDELVEFPFRYREIEPYYNEVSERIGITGVSDDLAQYYPVHANLMEPLRLDLHSERLLEKYLAHKNYLNRKLQFSMGRSRVAALTKDQNGRKACTYTGRCLWGCPSGAFYTPSLTLQECMSFPNFQYVPNMLVKHFVIGVSNRIESAIAESITNQATNQFKADRFILAAGTLSSSKIFMDSIRHATGEIIQLSGLMDNRQVLIPFINTGMIGKTYSPENYQYHQIALRIGSERPEESIHGLITTLKTALIHPIIQGIRLNLPTALFLFRNVRAGLGIVNVNFPDNRRDTNYVTLQAEPGSQHSSLHVHYSPSEQQDRGVKRGIDTMIRALRKMGCFVPRRMIHVRPMGASVHYAGTVPMSAAKRPYTTSRECRSHDFENLYFVDGTSFPSLPAKNLTFTLMANAIRVADAAF